jgi:hypothetical protein
MGLSNPVVLYPFSKLLPLYPGAANEIPVNLVPSGTYPRGTLLGEVTTSANDVQTVTIGGVPTGGTFTLNLYGPGGAATISPAYNASTAAVQSLVQAVYGTGSVVVTGSAGTSYVLTFGGQLANQPVPVITASTAGLTGGTPTIAVAHTTVGVTAGTWGTYASGNSDGTQNPTLILAYDIATGADGGAVFGSGATVGEWGQVYRDVPAYRKGTFRTSDLVGLDTNAVGKMGRLVSGTVTSGILQLI